jgi:hypothetical protein
MGFDGGAIDFLADSGGCEGWRAQEGQASGGAQRERYVVHERTR